MKTGIALLITGFALRLASQNEKPLTTSDIKAGDTISIRTLSNVAYLAGIAFVGYNIVKKK
jgi:hypothetical protein